MYRFLVVLAIILPLIQCGKLVELQLKTQDVEFANMDTEGYLEKEVCTGGGSACCYMQDIDLGYNQYERGMLEGFTGQQLGECDGLVIEDGDTVTVRLIHFGVDAWLGAYIRLLLDNGIYYQCPITNWLDDTDFVILECKVGQQ